MNLKKYIKICLFITIVIGILFIIFAISHPEGYFSTIYNVDIGNIIFIVYFSILFILILLCVCL